MGVYDTRIANFRVEPTIARIGEMIRISGNAQWYCPWWHPNCFPFGRWEPIEYETVELYVNGAKERETQTGEGGYFEFEINFGEQGNYIIQVHYPGSWVNNECWSDKVVVSVLAPEEYEEYMRRQMIIYGLIVAGVVGVVALVVGYYREREIVTLVAASD